MTSSPPTEHFADRLLAACRDKGGPVCVGLDPVYERLPASLRRDGDSTAAGRATALAEFTRGVLRAVAPHVPCVKFQSACYERYLWPGVEVLHRLIEEARGLGLIAILDAKRGDIGISSAHYAAGCLAATNFTDAGPRIAHGPDALTVNSYLGADGLEPFLKTAAAEGKGLFALVRTSNPGGDAIQGLKLADGRTVAEAVAQVMAAAGAGADGARLSPAASSGHAGGDARAPSGSHSGGYVGRSGYSLLGAVVGATKAADAARLRQLMPQQIFLVPGFGAQGGQADDVKACFKPDGTGAIITASRSVLYAYEKPATADWQGAIAAAAVKMKGDLVGILG